MGRRSVISQMPEEQRRALDAEIVKRGFGGYRELEEWLRDTYQIELSFVSVHRYGQALQSRIEAVKASTDAAVAIADAAPDDADLRSAAVMSMIQTEIFNFLVDLKTADDETDAHERLKMLSRAAEGIAALSRASVWQKKWKTEVDAKVRAVADEAEKIGKKGGLSADGAHKLRELITSIAA